jgi:hypothetical protein
MFELLLCALKAKENKKDEEGRKTNNFKICPAPEPHTKAINYIQSQIATNNKEHI